MCQTSSEYKSSFTAITNKRTKLRAKIINRIVNINKAHPFPMVTKNMIKDYSDSKLCELLGSYELYVASKSNQLPIILSENCALLFSGYITAC